MDDTNALFDSLLEAYRNADDPDRFLREVLIRLDDATANAVVSTERKLDRLDAARARLDAAREIPRPDTSEDGAEASADVEEDGDEGRGQDDDRDVEQAEAPPEPKKRRAKSAGSGADAGKRTRKTAS